MSRASLGDLTRPLVATSARGGGAAFVIAGPQYHIMPGCIIGSRCRKAQLGALSIQRADRRISRWREQLSGTRRQNPIGAPKPIIGFAFSILFKVKVRPDPHADSARSSGFIVSPHLDSVPQIGFRCPGLFDPVIGKGAEAQGISSR